MGPTPKHDYDSDDFYEEIMAGALQGMNDAEIADTLDLDPMVFSQMKNGYYPGWNDEQNNRRGQRIRRVLEKSRRRVNAIVRGRYLKAALGGIKTKAKATVYKRYTDEDTGEEVEKIVQRTETETELPPNIQALATWMVQHDPDWKIIASQVEEAKAAAEQGDGLPSEININIAYNNKSDLDLQGISRDTEESTDTE